MNCAIKEVVNFAFKSAVFVLHLAHFFFKVIFLSLDCIVVQNTILFNNVFKFVCVICNGFKNINCILNKLDRCKNEDEAVALTKSKSIVSCSIGTTSEPLIVTLATVIISSFLGWITEM